MTVNTGFTLPDTTSLRTYLEVIALEKGMSLGPDDLRELTKRTELKYDEMQARIRKAGNDHEQWYMMALWDKLTDVIGDLFVEVIIPAMGLQLTRDTRDGHEPGSGQRYYRLIVAPAAA